MPPAPARNRAATLLPVLIAAVILASQLLVKPVVGLADNGDFVNVTRPFQLEPADGRNLYFDYIVPQWRYQPSTPPTVRLITSEWLLIAPGYALSRLFAGGWYDLRWAGLTHMLLFLWAVWLAAPLVARLPGWRPFAVWAAILALFCDVACFSVYNSFYMDAASVLFLFLSAAFHARLIRGEGNSRRNAWGLVAALFLFLTSKVQHAVLLPAILALFVLDTRLRSRFSRRSLAGIAALYLLPVAGMFLHVPRSYSTYAAYNVLFTALLPHSPHPTQVLAEFGLPPELEKLSGQSAFAAQSGLNDPLYLERIHRSVTHTRLLVYYLRHPDAAVFMMKTALAESARERPPSRGNFARETGLPPQSRSRAFAVVSDLRSSAFANRPWLYAAYLVTVAAAACWYARPSPAASAMLLVAAMAAIEFFLGALADCQETTRHLFLFRVLMDLALVSIAVFLPARHLPSRREGSS
ncbi:MAG: hypothetical protein IANPNBLG_00677 [Bryobacteraceae bacterium]|nr:hypothetical protein [Bryobacteraceae bacterium]